MPLDSAQRKWWQHRRVRWPLGLALVLLLATATAILNSDTSRVVVDNDSGATILELSVSAAGRTKVFHNLDDRESVTLPLGGGGAPGEIVIITNGAILYRGHYIEPRGGHRATVRLRRDGQVEVLDSVSFWQRFLN